MKKYKLFFMIIILAFTSSSSAVNLSKGKGLACEAILCAVGIAIPASHSECKKKLRDWSIYLASHPFSSKPKCPKTDAKSEIVGYSEMSCSSIKDNAAKQQCNDAMNSRRAKRCLNKGFEDIIEECECLNNKGDRIPDCLIP